MNIPNFRRRAVLLVATMALAPLASHAAVESGYVTDQQDTGDVMIRSTDRQCVRTSAWSPSAWMEKCNFDGVTKVNLDPAPSPAPAPVVRAAVEPDYVKPEPLPAVVVAHVAPLPTERLILPADTLFDIDKAVIKPAGMAALDELVLTLKGNNRDILPVGHTSSPGTHRHNIGLSLRRAYAVKDYLVSQGIDPRRIHPSGKGEDYPVATNATLAGRTQNRRVEIEIGQR